jgi:hypothetical protein
MKRLEGTALRPGTSSATVSLVINAAAYVRAVLRERPGSSSFARVGQAVLLAGLMGIMLNGRRLEAAEYASPARIDLDGTWTFSIHGQGQRPMTVPSTYLPVGGATLERDFDLPHSLAGRRALLHFEGIVMTAEVWINGQQEGRYGPYTPFTIDISPHAKAGANHLRVDLSDLGGFDPWGRAWVTAFPRFGGIARDVFVELKSPVYIENARLDYQLADHYTSAACKLHTWVINSSHQPRNLELFGALTRRGAAFPIHASFLAPPGKSEQATDWSVRDLKLWSPEFPELYNLGLQLRDRKEVLDEFQTVTGFRELVTRGRDFYLNGKKIFLKGVFRHDIYGDQGHTLTRAQMEAEMKDIKSLGANFVRLGHYPQNRYINELAARYGLMTSGEPPIFGMSQKDPQALAAARFCLGGLIQRDWNNPAAVAWIISNEAGTDPGYMKEMVAFVRQLDPQRLASIVDNTHWTERNAPWQSFRDAGISFIAQNAYGSAFDGSYEKTAKFLPDDLPYVISEWGGTDKSYNLVYREGKYYLDHSNLAVQQGPRIAGISFWEYQDISMPRWDPEGLLHWSLVDKERRPYEMYYALKSLYTGKAISPPRGRTLAERMAEQLPRPLAPSEKALGYEPINLAAQVNSDQVIPALKAVSALAYPEDIPMGKVEVEGLPFVLERQVIALSRQQPSVHVTIGRAVGEFEFLGHVCFNSLAKKPSAAPPELPYLTEAFPAVETPPPFKGYPQAGEFGEEIGEYVLVYADGRRELIPLENGIHFADYRMFAGFSFIDPVATATERAVTYKGESGYKLYQLRLFTYRPQRPSQPLREIEFNLKNFDYVPILAGLTVRPYDVAVDAAQGPAN